MSRVITNNEIKTFLESYIGLSGRHTDLSKREENAKLLCPHDKLSWALSYLYGFKDQKGIWKIPSTCALFTEAYFRDFWNLSSKDLDSPYENQVGQVVSDLNTLGHKYNSWVSSKEELAQIYAIGDAIQIGDGVTSEIHWLNVSDYDPSTGALISIDGGQVDGSWITKRERLIISPSEGLYSKNTWLVDPQKPYRDNGSPNGRPVSAKISVEKLAKNLGYTLEPTTSE